MCRYWVPNEEPVPDFELDDGSGSKIRRDYYRLLTDLYISDHLLVLQAWSVSRGMRHKAQVAYGQNLEPIRSNREFVRSGGRAEGESLNSGDRAPMSRDQPTWKFALDWQRCLVGGAHQGGAVRVSTELGAQFQAAFAFSLGDYKQLLDKEWAAGITKPFVHGFASQQADADWPTQSRFWNAVADSWNDQHFPEWPNWRALTDYWARGTVILETGVPRTDVAIYREGFLTTAARGVLDVSADATAPAYLSDTEALDQTGYSVQYLDPVGLAEPGTVGEDGTLYPDGPAYRGLVLDEREMTPEAAEALDAAAQRGLKVVIVGHPPAADSGFAAAHAGTTRVQDAIRRLVNGTTVMRVDRIDEVAGAFRSLGLVPRVAWDGAALLTQWREAATKRYVLIYNTQSAAITTELSLEGRGGVRELDLWLGTFTDIPCRPGMDRTSLPVELQPLGLRVFELDLDADADRTHTPRDTDAAPAWQELPVEPWQVEVIAEERNGLRSILLNDQEPMDWREVDQLGGLSGAARYRSSVRTTSHRRFSIELGGLAGSAVVRAGGREFGPAYVSGTVLDLGDALHGEGDIEIEIRTPLRNAVVADGKRPNGPTVTVPHGILGPVRVLGSRS